LNQSIEMLEIYASRLDTEIWYSVMQYDFFEVSDCDCKIDRLVNAM